MNTSENTTDGTTFRDIFPLDRIVAIIAVLPWAYLFYWRFEHVEFAFPILVAQINNALFIVGMVTRRPPRRTTTNVQFWLISFFSTYGTFGPAFFAQPGVALVPLWISNTIAACALLLGISSRLTLGRNISIVPAQRNLVTTGPYAYIRHPIYTVVFLTYVSLNLQVFSVANLLMTSTVFLLFMLKSLAEEEFLKKDTDYVAYMQKVRYRWLPFIA
ncbi:MAG TPA: methyltransferase [Burkholderiaceae bacterium]|jgi:protein-S-isoprenylcysteine O-methyltransferase Ste14